MTPQVHAITARAPTDYETSPEAIWSAQKRDVRAAIRLGITTPPAISRYCCLPAWSIMRAIHEIETGERFQITPVKKRTRPKRSCPRIRFANQMAS